jgi:hypothetical protein
MTTEAAPSYRTPKAPLICAQASNNYVLYDYSFIWTSTIEFVVLSAYHPAAVALFFAVSHQPKRV